MLRKIDRLLKGKPRGIRWESVLRGWSGGGSGFDKDDMSFSEDSSDTDDPRQGLLETVLMAVGSVIGLVLALCVLLTIFALAAQPEPTPTPAPTIAFSDLPVRPVEVLPTLLPTPTLPTHTIEPSATPSPTDTPFPTETLIAVDTATSGPTLTFTPAPTLTPGVVFTLGMLFPQTPGSSGSSPPSAGPSLPPDPILFVRDGALWVIGSQGSGLAPLLQSSGRVQGPAWSPNRQQIAYSADVGGNLDIYVMDVSDLVPGRITNDFAADTSPTWTGARLVFASTSTGGGDLYSVAANGGDLRPITADVSVDREPAASPDGSRIVFVSNRDGGDFDLFVINADGGGLTQITADDKDSSQPAWSPDGARIAYLNGGDIYLLDIASQEVDALTQLGSVTGMSWSTDGSRIVFGAGGDLWIVSVTGGTPLPLTAGPERDSDPAWSR